jgi:uncharacterized protein (UPF0333 family)
MPGNQVKNYFILPAKITQRLQKLFNPHLIRHIRAKRQKHSLHLNKTSLFHETNKERNIKKRTLSSTSKHKNKKITNLNTKKTKTTSKHKNKKKELFHTKKTKTTITKTIKMQVIVEESLANEFRQKVGERLGANKGAISQAFTESLKQWINQK